MKKYKFIITAALMTSLVSCQDWLSMDPYTSDDTQTVFESESKAEIFVEGCYRGLINSDFYYQMGEGDCVTHASEDGGTNNSKYNICNYLYDATTPITLTGVYNEQYGTIEQANIAIKQLNNMPETKKRNQILGEALSIRAFSYLNLIRIYGDVPARWVPMEDIKDKDEALYPKRVSRDTIYDHIVADLQKAVDYIPWYAECGYPTPERISKQAANALLARTAMYAAGYSLRWNLETNDESTLKVERRPDNARVLALYEIADKACKDVIDHGANSLVKGDATTSGYQKLWYNHCQRNFSTTNPEMLWELAQYGATTNSDFGVLCHPGSRGGVFGSRKAMQFNLPTYYLSFDKNDTRRDVSCTSYSIYFLNKGADTDTWIDTGTTFSSIMCGKFRLSWCVEPIEAAKRNLDIPVLRYADVLLMYAEAENYLHNGPTTEGIAALKDVRDRAGIGAMAIPSNQSDFDDAIAQERKWEFSNEFMLRTDLIRMGRLAKEIKATQQAMKNLSDRKGDYANVATFRLYQYHVDAQAYGDKFLALSYVDITDPAEIAIIKTAPGKLDAAYQAKLAKILVAHSVTVKEGDMWYPINMFEAYNSSFNVKSRKTVGFTNGASSIQVGSVIYTKPTGNAENGGTYPTWITTADGSDGIYYGYRENHCELLPFANKSAGHPMIDNPNLTQLPGY